MKVTKGVAYLTSLASLLGIAVGSILLGAGEEEVGKSAITAIVALATAYFTLNVADNGVKGKFYQPGLAQPGLAEPGGNPPEGTAECASGHEEK